MKFRGSSGNFNLLDVSRWTFSEKYFKRIWSRFRCSVFPRGRAGVPYNVALINFFPSLQLASTLSELRLIRHVPNEYFPSCWQSTLFKFSAILCPSPQRKINFRVKSLEIFPALDWIFPLATAKFCLLPTIRFSAHFHSPDVFIFLFLPWRHKSVFHIFAIGKSNASTFGPDDAEIFDEVV